MKSELRMPEGPVRPLHKEGVSGKGRVNGRSGCVPHLLYQGFSSLKPRFPHLPLPLEKTCPLPSLNLALYLEASPTARPSPPQMRTGQLQTIYLLAYPRVFIQAHCQAVRPADARQPLCWGKPRAELQVQTKAGGCGQGPAVYLRQTWQMPGRLLIGPHQ